ncbi:MAG: extracellular solute-binding protein, partial [Candidatus Bathyarchaeia archaeon]
MFEAGVKEMWEDIIKKYEAQNPGISIELYGAPWSKASDVLIVELPTTAAPDIVMIPWPPITPLAPFLEPLDEYMEEFGWNIDDIAYQREPHISVWPKEAGGDDKIYCANHSSGEESALIYRKDIFKERGIPDPEEEGYPKWSLDEFLEVIRKCTYTKADGTKVFGYAFPTAPADGVSRWSEDWVDYLVAAGGGLVNYEKPGEII